MFYNTHAGFVMSIAGTLSLPLRSRLSGDQRSGQHENYERQQAHGRILTWKAGGCWKRASSGRGTTSGGVRNAFLGVPELPRRLTKPCRHAILGPGARSGGWRRWPGKDGRRGGRALQWDFQGEGSRITEYDVRQQLALSLVARPQALGRRLREQMACWPAGGTMPRMNEKKPIFMLATPEKVVCRGRLDRVAGTI